MEEEDPGASYGQLIQQTADPETLDLVAASVDSLKERLIHGTDPTSQNIFGHGSDAIIGYMAAMGRFEPIIAPSTDSLLSAFDVRTNSSVAIGSTKNSVYNSVALSDVKYTTTYYPIGDPNIMVSVSTNGADPYGEYWKCEHRNYSGDDTDDEGPAVTQKSVIITSNDGLRYCMPFSLAASVNQDHENSLKTDFKEKYGMDYLQNPAQDALGDEIFGVSTDWFADQGSAYDPLYGEVRTIDSRPIYSVLNRESWVEEARASDSVLSFNVVWDAAMISKLKIDPSLPEPPEPAGMFRFSKYLELRLKAEYMNRQVARENEFEITYSLLEKEGLLQRFASRAGIGVQLNDIYMGMAQFLASTYIESAYTFKTVQMQRLSNEQITPSNLAVQEGTAQTQRIVDSTVETMATSGYYPSDFVDPLSGEAYTSPASPVGGFWDASHAGYDRDEGIVDSDALVEGSGPASPGGGYGF